MSLFDYPQSGWMDFQHNLRKYRLQVAVVPTALGDAVEIGVEPHQLEGGEIEPIPEPLLEEITNLLKQPRGVLHLMARGALSWRFFAGILLHQASQRRVALWHGRSRPQLENLLAWQPDLEVDVVGFSDLEDSDWEQVRKAADKGVVLVLSEHQIPLQTSLGRLRLEWSTSVSESGGTERILEADWN